MFIEGDDYGYFLYLLQEVYKKFNFVIYSYCLMGNHLHLLLKDREAKLSEFLKILFQRYAQFFNLKYKRKGHLFARRFEAKLCLEDSYLLLLSRYIHLNPVKAKIVKEPRSYLWSSFLYYISRGKSSPNFLDTEFILNIFSGNFQAASRAYERYVYEGVQKGEGFKYPQTFYNTIGDPKRLLQLDIPERIKKLIEITTLSSREEIKFELEKIKDWEEVKANEARGYLVKQLYKRGLKIKEISKMLNCHFSTVSRMLQRHGSCI